MDIKQMRLADETLSERQLVLRPSSRIFRFGWLIAGLIAGYIVSLLDLSGVGLLVLLAAFTGASANWSS